MFRNRLCIDGGLTLFMPPTSASKTVFPCYTYSSNCLFSASLVKYMPYHRVTFRLCLCAYQIPGSLNLGKFSIVPFYFWLF